MCLFWTSLPSLSHSSMIIMSCCTYVSFQSLNFSSFCVIETDTQQVIRSPSVLSAQPAYLPISDSWLRSFLNQFWLEEIMRFSLHQDWEVISHAVLPVCTMPGCLFLSTRYKFSRRCMICGSEWVRKLLYKHCSVDFLFTFCCVWRNKLLISQCQ